MNFVYFLISAMDATCPANSWSFHFKILITFCVSANCVASVCVFRFLASSLDRTTHCPHATSPCHSFCHQIPCSVPWLFFVCAMKISIVVSYRCLCNFPLTFLLPLSTPPFTFSSSFCPRHWLIYAEDRNGAEDRVSVSLSRQHAETSVGLLKPNLRNCRKYHFPQKTDIRGKLHIVQ